MSDELVMYCIFSRESLARMGGNRGKMAAQAGHAFLHAYWNAERDHPYTARAYASSGAAAKVTLLCETDSQLKELYDEHRGVCGTTFVVDAGRTIFNGVPTLTCIGIGPITREQRSEQLAALKVLI